MDIVAIPADKKSEIELLHKESREANNKFYYTWAILSGGSLTLLFNSFKDLFIVSPVANLLAIISLYSILSSLIFSLLRNYFNLSVIRGVWQSRVAVFKGRKIAGKLLSFFSRARAISGLVAIVAYIIGLLSATIAFHIEFL